MTEIFSIAKAMIESIFTPQIADGSHLSKGLRQSVTKSPEKVLNLPRTNAWRCACTGVPDLELNNRWIRISSLESLKDPSPD